MKTLKGLKKQNPNLANFLKVGRTSLLPYGPLDPFASEYESTCREQKSRACELYDATNQGIVPLAPTTRVCILTNEFIISM